METHKCKLCGYELDYRDKKASVIRSLCFRCYGYICKKRHEKKISWEEAEEVLRSNWSMKFKENEDEG